MESEGESKEIQRPVPPQGARVAKLEVWNTGDGQLQVLSSIPMELADEPEGVLVFLARQAVMDAMEAAGLPGVHKMGVTKA